MINSESVGWGNCIKITAATILAFRQQQIISLYAVTLNGTQQNDCN